ncbi:hypothetical protein A0H76_1176 [Hepatospora eriocheir]|uniref:Uncharacterized protein n=1 Tax=Hepatospora eriocheir TaxID=1081669 RepID=A0A1X0QKS0_9MICR|nr:hypothetical protein A0H76_1176 [Hepatospora eriocheir]
MEFKQQEKKKPFWVCDRRFIFGVLILFAVTVFGLWFYFNNDPEKLKVKELIKYSEGFYERIKEVENRLSSLKDEEYNNDSYDFFKKKFLENLRILSSYLESGKNGVKKIPLKQLILFYNLIDLTNENNKDFFKNIIDYYVLIRYRYKFIGVIIAKPRCPKLFIKQSLYNKIKPNTDLFERFKKVNETRKVLFDNIENFYDPESNLIGVFICPETPKNFIEHIDIKIELLMKIDLLINAIGNVLLLSFIEKEDGFKKKDENLKKSDLFKYENALKLKYPIKSFNLDDIIKNLKCKDNDNDLFNIYFKNGLDEEKLNEYEKKEDKIREELKSN